MLLLALAAALGQFEAHADLGPSAAAGTATYNGATQEYVLRPGGTPHFAWKRLKGDFILQASVEFLEKEPGPQASAGLVVRTGTRGGTSFAGVVVRNDRLAVIQYRVLEGALNEQSESTLTTGDVIQLERRGSVYYFSAARFGVPLYTRQRADLPLGNDLYVGLAATTPTLFRNVRITRSAKEGAVLGSQLELLDVETGARQIVYRSPQPFESPSWTPDGSALTFTTRAGAGADARRRLVRFDLLTRQASPLNADISTRNDSWSPDGQYRLFVTGTGTELDIFRTDVEGLAPELRLTATKGLDAAPEYAPDGETVYFNSARSGKMQVWRMGAQGQNPQAVTTDDFNNWYPHVSPDGKWLAMLTYDGGIAPTQRPSYKHVYVRVMPIEGGVPKVIAYVYGGEGTLNVPSWSPDGKQIALVSSSDLP